MLGIAVLAHAVSRLECGVWEGGEGKGRDERELMIRQSLSAGSH